MDTRNRNLALEAIKKCAHEETVIQAVHNYVTTISSTGPIGCLAPIIVKFDFDHAQLTAATPKFLELLLLEPVQCLIGLREAVWCYVIDKLAQDTEYVNMCRENRSAKIQQIHCSIRFTGLPLTEDEFLFRPFVHPVRFGVTVMHCVLSGLGERGTYVQHSIWYCPSRCPDNECRIIGRCPFDWTQNYDCPKCSVCTINLKEHTDYRTVAEYRWIHVHLVENVRTQHQVDGRIKRAVIVQLVDEMCDAEVILGDEYIVVGNFDPMANRFNAWSISPLE